MVYLSGSLVRTDGDKVDMIIDVSDEQQTVLDKGPKKYKVVSIVPGSFDFTVINTGDQSTILGHLCEHYVVNQISPNGPLGRCDIMAMADFGTERADVWPFLAHGSVYFSSIKGTSIQLIQTYDGEINTTVNVSTICTSKLSADLFKGPNDYAPVK